MGHLGTPEILIILGLVVLLFGAKKLPELARGSGQALRIFKSEVKGDEEKPAPADALETRAVEAPSDATPEKKPEQQG
ncbi:MAG: twin-arginine translocase TatA/TatE family subunit [Aeromicrobium sp.]